jgi:hypothetical protein
VLHPIDGAGEVALEIFERLKEGRLLQSTVRIGPLDVSHVTAPAEGDLEAAAAQAAGTVGVRITLGNARAFLEGIPERRRKKLGPLLDRLGDTPSDPLRHPQPGAELSREEARRLVIDPLWRDWRPFLRLVPWTASELLPGRSFTADTFPGRFEDLDAYAERDATRALMRRTPATLNSELRHMALLLQLRGDPRAGNVAAETILIARRRPSVLLRALAERERWRQLWAHVPLPEEFRARLRERLRVALGQLSVEWTNVQLLDLAQAALEGMARDAGELGFSSGLADPDSLPLEAVMRLAEHASSILREPETRRSYARLNRQEILSQATRTWREVLPAGSLFEVAQFAGSTCFGACPHRCFEQKPMGSARDVFEARTPPRG